jgi:hypothetical protein
MLGCVIHTPGETFARLLYLAPATNLTHPSLIPLIENLATEAGTWGALHIIAEVDETSDAFVPLRNSGFSVYAWQRLWDVSSITGAGNRSAWTRAQSVNLPAIQSLYHQIVPPLLQVVEPLPHRTAGFLCNEGVKCYVSLSSGTAGIVLAPLIHPDAEDVGTSLSALGGGLSSRGARPVYLCVRSYQTWLEPVLEDLGALAGPRQAVMVKHLARIIKDEQAVTVVQPARVSVQPSRVSHIEGKRRS